MIFKTYFSHQTSYDLLCEQCFSTLSPLNKWRKDFFKGVLWLFLSINARVNFLQLARYGHYGEQRYRQQFNRKFDFFDFNSKMVKQHCGSRKAIAFDPSYISKSGKHTPGVGYFWSGCAGKAKWGLEINGIAALDLDNHTALHLEAVQTLPKEGENLLSFYARIIVERAEKLKDISNVVVADAYFSKKEFIDQLAGAGLYVVSRLRDDARLQYIIEPIKTGKPGRPATNGGMVDVKNLNMQHFTLVPQEDENIQVYTAVVKAVAMKRKVRVVVVRYMENKKPTTKIYFSTNIELEAIEILAIYKTRFQIEFLYRDAKQHTALTTCQALSENRLDFHFNISLTAVNVAKVIHWFSIPKSQREEFSMSDIKIMNHNALLLDRFIAMFAIKPNILKNNQNVKELILYGTKCA